MKNLLVFLLILGSCTAKKKIFNSKTDFIQYENSKYIYSTVSKNKKYINDSSEYHVTIPNNSNDTIYIFSTVLENNNMLYSGKNIHHRGSIVVLDTYYPDYFNDALHSGIKKFNFIQVLPNDTLITNIDKKRIVNDSNINLQLQYYYFEKNGQNFNGLLNINKIKLIKGVQEVN